jgi:predicted nicotinamide N-methyase
MANGVDVATTDEDQLPTSGAGFDVILVGDLFYERALADAVLAFIDRAKSNGALILIGDPKRSYFPRNRFTLVASFNVAVSRDLEDAEIKHTSVWQA